MSKPTITYDAPEGVAPTQDLMKRHWDGEQPCLHVTVAFADDSEPAVVTHNLVLDAGHFPALQILATAAGVHAGLPLVSFPDRNTVVIDRSTKGAETSLVLDVWIHRRGCFSVAPKK